MWTLAVRAETLDVHKKAIVVCAAALRVLIRR
jgi:hypothetical protein